MEALAEYRSAFRPSPSLDTPRTLLPVRACVADTREEAHRAVLPWLLVMLGLQRGRPEVPVPTIERAEWERSKLSETDRKDLSRLADGYVIGDATDASAQVRELAAAHGVDEVMIHPVAGAHDGEDPRASAGQSRTLQLLAEGVNP